MLTEIVIVQTCPAIILLGSTARAKRVAAFGACSCRCESEGGEAKTQDIAGVETLKESEAKTGARGKERVRDQCKKMERDGSGICWGCQTYVVRHTSSDLQNKVQTVFLDSELLSCKSVFF